MTLQKEKIVMGREKNPPQEGLLLMAGTVIKFTIGNLFKDYFSLGFFCALCKSGLKGRPFSQPSPNAGVCSHEQPLNLYLALKTIAEADPGPDRTF